MGEITVMAKNDFKPFATAANANVMSQADWEGLPALLSGFTSGKAASAEVNKAIRQASFIAAALAQYTANKSGLDVLDDADLNGFITKMTTAFGKDFQALDATLTAIAGLATGANKLPYFSGVDQMATADLTSFARGLLGKTDAATAKAHLGVGSAGGRNVGAGFSAGGSEIPDMTFFAGLKGSAGYQYFPTGMLLQWGTVGLKSAPSGTSIGTFPVAFPAAGQQIVVTHDNPLTNVIAFGAASIIDPTQFRVNAIAINADTFTMAPGYNLTLRWFAIGS
ncbi:gp53-like domain-containing protein [Enterobacter roggenkampii]|uniref:gp53-like domain-containing protein n=1 Tax=Enterobacter roggenkampii TaxID=1812935 RepID=UPI003B75CC5F